MAFTYRVVQQPLVVKIDGGARVELTYEYAEWIHDSYDMGPPKFYILKYSFCNMFGMIPDVQTLTMYPFCLDRNRVLFLFTERLFDRIQN